jgi:hypothetical protein
VNDLELAQKNILEGNFIQGRDLIRKILNDKDDLAGWKMYAELMIRMNNNLEAMAILRNVVFKLKNPHIADLISARVPYTKAIYHKGLDIVYIPVPKCGSSSVKDSFHRLLNGKYVGESVHSKLGDVEILVKFSNLDEEYKDTYKFCVVRDPIERLRSYYKKNIIEEKSLVAESKYVNIPGQLSLLPSYQEIIKNFYQYRSLFRDFRHHTDPLTGFLGINAERYTHIYNMKTIDLLFSHLSSKANTDLKVVHQMKSKSTIDISSNYDSNEIELLRNFYKNDIEIYEKYWI